MLIKTIKVFIISLLAFLSSCTCSLDDTKLYPVQYLGGLSTDNRENIESYLKENIHFLSGSSYGQISFLKKWKKPLEPPENYGQDFFKDITNSHDLFLTINLSSDYDYKNWNDDKKKFSDRLLPQNIKTCNSNNYFNLFTYPNTETAIADNLHHITIHASIPVLINRGIIKEKGKQQDLCLSARDVSSECIDPPAFCITTGLCRYRTWDYQEVRIEANQIETIMKNLKDQGIEYDYPENPIN